MGRRILVAVVYNEIPISQGSEEADLPRNPLDFEPYFDLERKETKEEICDIVKALKKEGLEAISYNLQGHVENLIKVLKTRRPDVVFNLVESFYDSTWQEMMAAGICEIFGLPYTGSPPLTLGICQRKGLSKQVLLANGIRTPRFQLIAERDTSLRHRLRYPLMVKPAREDGSMGIENESVVYSLIQLRKRLNHVLDEFHQPAILEEFIEGRELSVSILGEKKPLVLPISEVDFSQMPDSYNSIYTYQAKWEPRHETYHRTIPICPAHLSKRTELRIKEIALKAYRVMGCRDYVRVDLRLDRTSNPFVLEVNPNPYLSEGVGFMRSAEANGLSFSQTLRKIVEFALRRSNE
jgi:D-alanine-D-alanine ligase